MASGYHCINVPVTSSTIQSLYSASTMLERAGELIDSANSMAEFSVPNTAAASTAAARMANELEECSLAGSFMSVDELLMVSPPQPGDLVVLDVMITGSLTGLAAVEHLTALGASVIILTALEDRTLAEALRHAGARAVVHKGNGPGALVEALRSVDTDHDAPPMRRARALFTDREREVLQLISDGLRNRQIAREGTTG
jgi:DNA-binding NarL/FixJ family response regulator